MAKSRVIDISMTIEPAMQVWKNYPHKKPMFTIHDQFSKGGIYETDLAMNLHTGTHLDAPLHMIEGGKNSDALHLERLMAKASVIDLTNVIGAIRLKDIEKLPIRKGDFVLFKTKNSLSDSFEFEFVYLALDAAEWLAKQGIAGVGIDALGIERAQEGHPTHHALLKRDILILEGLRLRHVPPGRYQLICLPLKIANVEALPCRAILLK